MASYDSPRSSYGGGYPSPSRQDRRHLVFLESDEPEMLIPEKVEIKGDIEFIRYLSIDGQFDGNITTNQGNLFVGPNGYVISDLKNMGTVVIEGTVMGNIHAEKLIMRGHASVTGDVTCSSVEMGPQSTMIGQMKSIFYPSDHESPSKDKKLPLRNVMFILDPQVDFHYGGTCAIKGADENSEAIARFIQSNKASIQDIFIGLDSHHRMHISHGVFWTNAYNESPPPFTSISYTDIEEQSWRPRDSAKEIQEYCKVYAKEIELKKRMSIHIWPEHCLIGSPGHAIVPSVNQALQDWAEHALNTVTYIMKGTNCLTEMYSALCAEVPIKTDASTCLDMKTLARLESADKVILCGQSLSHSVNFTCRDIVENWKSDPSKLYIVLDGSSCVAGFENDAANFISDMKHLGVNITTFSELDILL
jgi:nicotinamidase/pyrazinamidase